MIMTSPRSLSTLCASLCWCSIPELRVVRASRSFYLKFELERLDVEGRSVYAIADGLWNIAELKTLLEEILPLHAVMGSLRS